MLRIYLDTCCYNRPFDDQTQDRIRLESEAVRLILRHVENQEWFLIGSEVLQYEVSRIPHEERKVAVATMLEVVDQEVPISEEVVRLAEALEREGIDAYDAYHLACGTVGKTNVFFTVDDRLAGKASEVERICGFTVTNPVTWIRNQRGLER